MPESTRGSYVSTCCRLERGYQLHRRGQSPVSGETECKTCDIFSFLNVSVGDLSLEHTQSHLLLSSQKGTERELLLGNSIPQSWKLDLRTFAQRESELIVLVFLDFSCKSSPLFGTTGFKLKCRSMASEL